MSLNALAWTPSPREVVREVPVLVPAVGLEQAFGVKGYYEAGTPSPERPMLLSTRQDADQDSAFYRERMAEDARYLERNCALLAGIVERMVTFVVGTGVNPWPMTSDEGYDAEARAAWEARRNHLDLETDFSWNDVLSVIYGTSLVEGGLYDVLTYDAGAPKIQLIDFHRVDGRKGIEFDANGKPSVYRFLLSKDRSGPYMPVESEFVVPHYTPRRPRQHYPVTIFSPILNIVRDIDDIVRFEKAAVKYTSSIIEVIENETGEAKRQNLVTQRWGQAAANRTDAADPKNEQLTWLQKVFGAAVRFVPKGLKYQNYTPQRPSQTWQGFMDFLDARVCMPLGMPPSTLLPIKVGGADTRRDLAMAARVVERHQDRLAHQCHRIYRHVIDFDLGKKGRPENWDRAEWLYSRSITADAGRQAQQDREDLGMGTNTLSNFCAENGYGGLIRFLEQRAMDRVAVKNVAEKYKITPAEVFNFDYKSQPSLPVQQNQPEPAATT
jgi:hypothetical protein